MCAALDCPQDEAQVEGWVIGEDDGEESPALLEEASALLALRMVRSKIDAGRFAARFIRVRADVLSKDAGQAEHRWYVLKKQGGGGNRGVVPPYQ